MSQVIPIRLPKLIKEFQQLDASAREHVLEVLEAACESAHIGLDQLIQENRSESAIYEIGQLEKALLCAYNLISLFHSPNVHLDKDAG